MPKLLDHAKLQHEGLGLHLDDIQGITVEIMEVNFRQTQYGEMGLMTVNIPDVGEDKVGTFAVLVVDALKNADKAGSFPCDAKFVKDGRIWRIE